MKYSREIKVAVLAAVALFLLYFGFNFLKGVNVFRPVQSYYGRFADVDGLVEQAAVYIRGYKVGQVDEITYDFSKDSAFLISISVNDDIALPSGTRMAIGQNGLMGGTAIFLLLPQENGPILAEGSFLPTSLIPSVMDEVQSGLLARINTAVEDIDSLVLAVSSQLQGDRIASILTSVDSITYSLTSVSADLVTVTSDVRTFTSHSLPSISERADTLLSSAGRIAYKVDTLADHVNGIVSAVDAGEGTLGALVRNPELYRSLDSTLVSIDSLITDIKAHPKRYINVTIFGRKDSK